MHSRKWLSVMSGHRRETGTIEPLKPKDLRGDFLESAPSLSRRAGARRPRPEKHVALLFLGGKVQSEILRSAPLRSE